MNIYYIPRIGLQKRQHGFYPQEAGRFVLVIVGRWLHCVVTQLSSKVECQESEINIQAMYSTERARQPKYCRQAEQPLKTPPK